MIPRTYVFINIFNCSIIVFFFLFELYFEFINHNVIEVWWASHTRIRTFICQKFFSVNHDTKLTIFWYESRSGQFSPICATHCRTQWFRYLQVASRLCLWGDGSHNSVYTIYSVILVGSGVSIKRRRFNFLFLVWISFMSFLNSVASCSATPLRTFLVVFWSINNSSFILKKSPYTKLGSPSQGHM